MARLVEIGAIGPANAEKLRAVGVGTTETLLLAGATSEGRAAISAETGIAEDVIRRWVAQADLLRIKGLGSEHADLLETAGIDGVSELVRRNATHLQAKLFELNERRRLVRNVPNESQIARWIEHAKRLERGMHH